MIIGLYDQWNFSGLQPLNAKNNIIIVFIININNGLEPSVKMASYFTLH